MKLIKLAFSLILTLTFALNSSAATTKKLKTAEEVYSLAKEMKTLDREVLKSEIKSLSLKEKTNLVKIALHELKTSKTAADASIAEYILAVLIPPVAVGIHTDWKAKPVVSNILWCFLGGLPGIVHAFVVLGR